MMEGNVWQIVSLSLRVAGIAIIVALPVAFIVAWILARFNFPGKSLAQAIVTMPLVLPPVVTGYLLLILFGARGALGAPLQEWFGLSFAFRWTGAALAAGVMAFPLLVRPIRLSIEGLDRGLEEAARAGAAVCDPAGKAAAKQGRDGSAALGHQPGWLGAEPAV